MCMVGIGRYLSFIYMSWGSCFPPYPLCLCNWVKTNRRQRSSKLTRSVSFIADPSSDETTQPRVSSKSINKNGKQTTGRKRTAANSKQLQELPEGCNVRVQLTQGSIKNIELCIAQRRLT